MGKRIITREDVAYQPSETIVQDETWRNGIEESFRAQIADAETQEQKRELAEMICESANDGHLSHEQANKLIKELGVVVESTAVDPAPEKETTQEADDRRAWESTLRDEYQALRTASLEVRRLKDELKEARKIVAEREATITRLVGEGSTGFKSRRLF